MTRGRSPRLGDASSSRRTPPVGGGASPRERPDAGLGRVVAGGETPFPEPIHLDNHLLVVVKPAGMLSQADRTGDLDLASAAKAYLKARFDRPGDVFVGLVHRLDRPVSGVMVLARTSKAAARLSEQFRTRTVAKRYLALVEGRLDGRGRRTDWLLKQDEDVRIVAPGTAHAREATLSWEALWTDGRRSLVGVHLETGRAHQIRVQLAALGHPILGDRRHGATSVWRRGAIALHAATLAFEHPTQRVPLGFAAPPHGWGIPVAPIEEWLSIDTPGTGQGADRTPTPEPPQA